MSEPLATPAHIFEGLRTRLLSGEAGVEPYPLICETLLGRCFSPAMKENEGILLRALPRIDMILAGISPQRYVWDAFETRLLPSCGTVWHFLQSIPCPGA